MSILSLRKIIPLFVPLICGVALGIGAERGVFASLMSAAGLSASPAESASVLTSRAAGGTAGAGAGNAAEQASAAASAAAAAGAGKLTPAQARARLARWLERGGDGGDARDFARKMNEVVCPWAREDPRGALKFIHDAPRFPRRAEACAAALIPLYFENAPEAVAWMRGNLGAEEREAAARAMVDLCKSQCPMLAVDVLCSEVSPQWNYSSREAFRNLARVDSAMALQYFNKLPDEARRRQCVGDIVGNWPANDLAAATAWCLSQRGESFGAEAVGALIEREAESHPGGLAEFVRQIEPTSGELSWCFTTVAKSAPDVAMGLLQNLPADEREWPARLIVSEVFKNDPNAALELAGIYAKDGDGACVVANAWETWAASDRKAAEQWLATVGDATVKNEIQARMLLHNNPAGYLDAVASGAISRGGDDYVSEALLSVACSDGGSQGGAGASGGESEGAGASSNAAFDWLIDNPGYINRERANTAFNANMDPQVLLARVSTLTDPDKRDAVLLAASQVWINATNYDMALAVMPALADAGQQTAMMFQIYLSKSRDDEAGAKAWLATQDMSEETRASWINIAKGF